MSAPPRSPRQLAIVALAAGAAAAAGALAARARVPPEVRRLTYRPTLFEELQGALTDPAQLGMLMGAAVGAAAVAIMGASPRRARRAEGLLLTVTPEQAARAAAAGEQAARGVKI